MQATSTHPGVMLIGIFLLSLPVSAQTNAPLVEQQVDVSVDSGWIVNAGSARCVVYSTTVESPGVSWMRLRFDLAELGETPAGEATTILQITSLLDNAVQRLDTAALRRWSSRSAFFNGDAVTVEIIADAGAGPSRLVMSHAAVGAEVDGGVATICGPDDDRVPSGDARAGRLVPAGCTAWLIDDANHCLLTAGHCGLSAGSVVEFDVPDSDRDGGLQHPPPEDQYPVDTTSVQSFNGALGNDWAYFGCFENNMTGLTAVETQGDYYVTTADTPPVDGQTIRITGFGVDSTPPELNQVQQTHAGPYAEADGSILRYEVDTTGGNSGSAVLDESTGIAIGIHTNGGCTSTGGLNIGTSLNNPQLQEALANPLGVCMPIPPVEFSFPSGLPDLLDPHGEVIPVTLLPTKNGAPAAGSARLHYELEVDGRKQGLVTVDLVEVAEDMYEAQFPAIACGTAVSYFFSADSRAGEPVQDPLAAPATRYRADAGDGFDTVFADDFETDNGWTVQNTPVTTIGPWERGIPAGGGDRGDPAVDADGSSRCYVTGLADGNNDVDDGATTLTSPIMDATDGDAHITYHRWFSNTNGAAPQEDTFTVEISGDGGQSWQVLEIVGPTGPEADGDWYDKSFRVADFMTPTDQFQIRFTASDVKSPSVIEAGVDGVRLNRSASGLICTPSCVADVGSPPDGEVGVGDLLAVILAWGSPGGAADVNGDGVVDVLDLLVVVEAWGRCDMS